MKEDWRAHLVNVISRRIFELELSIFRWRTMLRANGAVEPVIPPFGMSSSCLSAAEGRASDATAYQVRQLTSIVGPRSHRVARVQELSKISMADEV